MLPREDLAYYAGEFKRVGFRGSHIIEGAGHWIQRERAATVNSLLLEFLRAL